MLTEAVFEALPREMVRTIKLAGYRQLVAMHTPSTALPIQRSDDLSENHRQMISRFFPNELLERTSSGEFRQIVAVFINLAQCPHGAESTEFQQLLFQHLAQFNGYLCSVGRTGPHDSACTLILFWGAPTSHENDILRATVRVGTQAFFTNADSHRYYLSFGLCRLYWFKKTSRIHLLQRSCSACRAPNDGGAMG
ncbi:MAG: hypothetical protein R2932_46905 [Caldilineaceae bacterium]